MSLLFDGSKQLMADFRHFFAVAKLGKVIAGHGPPSFECVMMRAQGLLQSCISFQRGLDSGLCRNGRHKGEVAGTVRLKQGICRDAKPGKIALSGSSPQSQAHRR